jgi:ureidoacrylate peracid hydrolase
MTETLSREIAIDPKQTALLFIDVQNFAAKRNGGEFKEMPPAELERKCGWYFQQMESRVVPNMQRLQAACRKAEVEVMYTTIESLTLDGRDRSLDYKITGFHVPKGSWKPVIL